MAEMPCLSIPQQEPLASRLGALPAAVRALCLALLCSTLACSSATTSRQACLNELEKLVALRAEGLPERNPEGPPTARATRVVLNKRLSELRAERSTELRASELAWFLVPALGLHYRLRHGSGPDRCHTLFVEMGLLPPGSGSSAVSLDELRRVVNRAALPETELLLPGPRPLPRWLGQR